MNKKVKEDQTIKQAVLLSAGLGTRLREVTGKDVPKVMVEIAGKPLLRHHIEHLKTCGVREFFINLHHLPDVIRDYFGDGAKFGVEITYAHEPEIRGTAGGVKNFENKLGEHFLVLYGDTVYTIDLERLFRFYFSKKDAAGLITVRKTDHPEDSDLAAIDEDSRVVAFYCKPHPDMPNTHWGSSAPYILSKGALSFIPKEQYCELAHDVIPRLLADGRALYAYCLREGEFRKDIGTPERYREIHSIMKDYEH